MPERDWLFRLDDMLVCTRRAIAYVGSLTERELAANQLVLDAVLRNLEIIDEAATQLPEACRTRHASIPWPEIRGMRNRIVHDYPGIDVAIVYRTVTSDLKQLELALGSAIDFEKALRNTPP